jgi:hypothetical protein
MIMIEHEVPHDEWHVFLSAFNARHQGWLIQCDHFGQGVAEGERSPFLPFFEVSFVDEGTPERFVAVVVKEGDSASIVSIMPRPAHLSLVRTLEGAEQALRIAAANGETLCIAFRTALLAELIDTSTLH